MHRTWRESGLGKTHKEVTRVLEACKGGTVDSLRHGREKEQLGRRWTK